MSGKLADNLRSSVAIGAVHGTHQERSICENQMVAAANELDERFRQILQLEAKVERLSKVLKEAAHWMDYVMSRGTPSYQARAELEQTLASARDVLKGEVE